MNLRKLTVVVMATFALAGLWASEAAAQAPTVTYQVTGDRLRVQWNAVPGATHYDIVVGGSLSGQVSVPTTFVEVGPVPPGTYLIAVRGAAPGVAGPFSAPVTIAIGGAGPCGAMAAPQIAVSTTGNIVNLSWGAVPGAVGYRVQVGRAPGTTDIQFDVAASQRSHATAVPYIGTFYVRVLAGNSCGTITSSSDTAFTIGSPTPGPGTPPPTGGAGPRTPDPAPGTIIPRASLGYLRGVVEAVAAQYRGDLLNSCATSTFMYRVVHALRQIDTRWGLNYKRGNFGDLSHDIVAYNPTNRPDNGESQIYLYDIIAGHCGSNPGPNWQDVTDPTWAGRGNSACGTEWCARWTLDPYLRAGFPADPRP